MREWRWIRERQCGIGTVIARSRVKEAYRSDGRIRVGPLSFRVGQAES